VKDNNLRAAGEVSPGVFLSGPLRQRSGRHLNGGRADYQLAMSDGDREIREAIFGDGLMYALEQLEPSVSLLEVALSPPESIFFGRPSEPAERIDALVNTLSRLVEQKRPPSSRAPDSKPAAARQTPDTQQNEWDEVQDFLGSRLAALESLAAELKTYLDPLGRKREPPTEQSLMFRIGWLDCLVRHLAELSTPPAE